MIVTIADGARLHVEADPASSSKPALIFSNSLGTDLHMWNAEAEALRARFRIIRYDVRGHGRSYGPRGDCTIERLALDALAVLDAAGAEKAHLVGLSMGGMVGMWLGSNRPERMLSLALCNTSAHIPPKGIWDDRAAAVRKGGFQAITEGVLGRWFTAPFRAEHPQAVDRVRRMLLANDVEGYCGCVAAIRDMDLRETIRAIAVPTLVLAGASDPITPPAHGRQIHDAAKGSRYAEIAAAHLSNIEAPAAFLAAVGGFLK
jgi:3-oxoadipate enol-lactonase